MRDVLRVHVADRAAELPDDVGSGSLGVGVAGVEVTAGAELHYHKHLTATVEDFNGANNVWVVKGLEDVNLILKLRYELVGHAGKLDCLEGVQARGLRGARGLLGCV